MRYEWRFHASPRPGRHCVIVAIGAACLLLACTTVRAQPAGSNPTAPEQPDQKTAPTTEDKPAEAADFPGAGLFNSHPLFLVGVKVSHSDLRYKEGDLLSATFTAEKEAFLYLLYHQADGQSLLLYPNPAARDHRLPAQESVTIPTPGGNFRFRVQPPLGQEVFQVLATTAPAPELDDLVQDGSQGALVTAEVIERLRARLAQDLSSWTEHRVRIETVAGAVTQAARPARRVSLLIGVDDYEDPKLCEPGARFRTGAELMRDALTQRGGVSPQDTKILLGKDATRAGIEEALVRWLPSVSAPGDTVFIFYTGHGVTIPSDDPDKPGGRDGLLSTYDNKVPGPVESVAQLEGQLRDKQISDDAVAAGIARPPDRVDAGNLPRGLHARPTGADALLRRQGRHRQRFVADQHAGDGRVHAGRSWSLGTRQARAHGLLPGRGHAEPAEARDRAAGLRALSRRAAEVLARSRPTGLPGTVAD
jgi:hypothetical protein